MRGGFNCHCLDAYSGTIDWTGDQPSGTCTPAQCHVQGSNFELGHACECGSAFVGTITWDGDDPTGDCQAAPCNITHSNKEAGSACACEDGYRGEIEWNGPTPSGSCAAVPCHVAHSNMQDGPACECLDGFSGSITWTLDSPSGTCLPAVCHIPNSNRELGLNCACSDGYSGNISWSKDTPSGTCHAVACTVENSNFHAGPACHCSDSYAGTISWSGVIESGGCTPAPCSVEHSNEEPGESCACDDGYTGEITWALDQTEGTCTAAPCGIEHSNTENGPACACLDAYSGHITWVQDSPRGSCIPAECDVPGSNMKHGLDCACANGNNGNITWVGDTPQGSCSAVACPVPHSNGLAGDACACLDGYTGTIVWTDNVVTGTCDPAPCGIEHSDEARGPACACGDGFSGRITWSGEIPNGTCSPATCAVDHSNMEAGWGCHCVDGYQGDIRWDRDTTTGECTAVPCTAAGSNMLPGPACECTDAYVGEITWAGPHFSGGCSAAPCSISSSNFRPGPACACDNGYVGNVSWHSGVPSGQCDKAQCLVTNSNMEDSWACACSNGYAGDITWTGPIPQGSCSPAPCDVPNSNAEPGLACHCSDGYSGEITWAGSVTSGLCMAIGCEIPHSNGLPSTSCACADGYSGTITWAGTEASGVCTAAPCRVANSNMEAGPDCHCLNGFAGNVTWERDMPVGDCTPAPCAIANSTLEPGLACRCSDGFYGNVTWGGRFAYGDCRPATCEIAGSNMRAGPDCLCEDPFFGIIHWNGSAPTGSCSPACVNISGHYFHNGHPMNISQTACEIQVTGYDALATGKLQGGTLRLNHGLEAVGYVIDNGDIQFGDALWRKQTFTATFVVTDYVRYAGFWVAVAFAAAVILWAAAEAFEPAEVPHPSDHGYGSPLLGGDQSKPAILHGSRLVASRIAAGAGNGTLLVYMGLVTAQVVAPAQLAWWWPICAGGPRLYFLIFALSSPGIWLMCCGGQSSTHHAWPWYRTVAGVLIPSLAPQNETGRPYPPPRAMFLLGLRPFMLTALVFATTNMERPVFDTGGAIRSGLFDYPTWAQGMWCLGYRTDAEHCSAWASWVYNLECQSHPEGCVGLGQGEQVLIADVMSEKQFWAEPLTNGLGDGEYHPDETMGLAVWFVRVHLCVLAISFLSAVSSLIAGLCRGRPFGAAWKKRAPKGAVEWAALALQGVPMDDTVASAPDAARSFDGRWKSKKGFVHTISGNKALGPNGFSAAFTPVDSKRCTVDLLDGLAPRWGVVTGDQTSITWDDGDLWVKEAPSNGRALGPYRVRSAGLDGLPARVGKDLKTQVAVYLKYGETFEALERSTDSEGRQVVRMNKGWVFEYGYLSKQPLLEPVETVNGTIKAKSPIVKAVGGDQLHNLSVAKEPVLRSPLGVCGLGQRGCYPSGMGWDLLLAFITVAADANSARLCFDAGKYGWGCLVLTMVFFHLISCAYVYVRFCSHVQRSFRQGFFTDELLHLRDNLHATAGLPVLVIVVYALPFTSKINAQLVQQMATAVLGIYGVAQFLLERDLRHGDVEA